MTFKHIYTGWIIIVLLIAKMSFAQGQKKTITFPSSDKVEVTADIYLTKNMEAPFILLFHQAGYSRGEYLEIAPKLNALGYNCMAIDQRSGNGVNGITNETHKDAVLKGKNTKYPDAYVDLEAALAFVKEKYEPSKLLVWGSSYSSSLVFILAAKHSQISAVLSFSPGEYFKFEGREIGDWAKQVTCPIFVTSSKKESERCASFISTSNNIKSIQYIPTEPGFHGSKALWKEKKGHEGYWLAVMHFLNEI